MGTEAREQEASERERARRRTIRQRRMRSRLLVLAIQLGEAAETMRDHESDFDEDGFDEVARMAARLQTIVRDF